MNKKAFSLVEIIVSLIILSLTFSILLVAPVASRRYIQRANRRLAAANLAREFLNNLYPEVRIDTWNTGNLSHNGIDNKNINEVYNYNNLDVTSSYNLEYNVEQPLDREYRQVTVNVSY